MDDGTDAMDMMEGRIVPLRQGYVPVICRSTANLHKKSIREALKDEEVFFRTHNAYRAHSQRCGVPHL